MEQEREALVTLVSTYEVTPYLAAKVLEHGPAVVSNRPRWLNRSNRFTIASSSNLTKSVEVTTYLDPEWPAALFDLDDEMPLALWCKSKKPNGISSIPGIGIVGKRTPSLSDIRVLGRLLDSEITDLPLVTAAAPGINEQVIKTASRKKQLVQVISAAGFKVQQPQLSWKARSGIAQYGVLLSEYPPRAPFSRDRMLRRNRIIAALSASVVVIGEPNNSAAVGIWHWATVLGRETIAI